MNQTTDSVRSQQSGLKRTVMNRRTKLIFVVVLIFVVLSGIYLAGNIISDDLIVADFSQKGLKLHGNILLVRTCWEETCW